MDSILNSVSEVKVKHDQLSPPININTRFYYGRWLNEQTRITKLRIVFQFDTAFVWKNNKNNKATRPFHKFLVDNIINYHVPQ